ncbi:MAG: DUF2752 domain-containing protein [Actinomycetia bacterium]|nr:DUF2752 domain-containing protein [Actinomycetes bacterium]MCP4962649.1 DUF2752 domain-containing protein [Actinomycetes bacterium]
MTIQATYEHPRLVAPPRLLAIGGVVAAFGASFVVGGEDGPTLCPYRRCTGGYCPGCGATRAASRFVRGDFGAAFAANPVAAFIGLQVALAMVWIILRPDAAIGWFGPRLQSIATTNALLLLVVWPIRLAAGHIPLGF